MLGLVTASQAPLANLYSRIASIRLVVVERPDPIKTNLLTLTSCWKVAWSHCVFVFDSGCQKPLVLVASDVTIDCSADNVALLSDDDVSDTDCVSNRFSLHSESTSESQCKMKG